MTAPDPTAPTAEDVIARAIRDGLTPLDGRYALGAATAAVVAAIRAMSPETLAELIGGHVWTWQAGKGVSHGQARVVGPWQETP